MSYPIFPKFVLATFVICGVLAGCSGNDSEKKQKVPPQKIVSLDPADSVAYNELIAFYLQEGILPQEAFVCDHAENGALYPLCCLSEDAQCALCAPDYMQDSLHGTFFQEIDFDMGSSGDANIYICEKNTQGFQLLYSVVGTIDLDQPSDQFVNGYRIIYFTNDSGANKRKLYFNGKKFVEEDIPDDILANK